MTPHERKKAVRDAKQYLLELLDDEGKRFEDGHGALTRARKRLAELQEALALDRELNPRAYREPAKRPL